MSKYVAANEINRYFWVFAHALQDPKLVVALSYAEDP